MIRWECPNAKHAAVLGSTRPRKNAVVRFCLECSASSDLLVERVPAALEKKRTVRAAKAKAKQKSKAQKQRESKYFVGNIDARKEARKILSLDRVKAEHRSFATTLLTTPYRFEDYVVSAVTGYHLPAQSGSWPGAGVKRWDGRRSHDRAELIFRMVRQVFGGWDGPSVWTINDYLGMFIGNSTGDSVLRAMQTYFKYEGQLDRVHKMKASHALSFFELAYHRYESDEAYREALSIAADAFEEGRHEDCNAILAQL